MYKISLTKTAEKEYLYLYKTNKMLFDRVRNALRFIAKNPTAGKPLRLTLKGRLSYRVGNYRIIYSIEHRQLVIYVLDIGHRREVYRR